MALSVFVRDDLVQVGVDWEDGEAVLARSLYVVAEAPDGRRWGHDRSFLDRVRGYDVEEGQAFWARRPDGEADAEAAALLARVEAHLAAGGSLDPAHWVEVDPAYGSAAYQDLDAVGYFRGRERAEAYHAGEAGVRFGSEAADLLFA